MADPVVTTSSDFSTEADDGGLVDVAVFGLGTYAFDLIHITALICQVISITASGGVLIVVLKAGHFYKKPIGDRLVVYLSFCDLGFTVCHVMDHLWMEITRYHPPDPACTLFAFFLNQFILAQCLFIIYSAVNAFVMVVRERKIDTGTKDWKLLTFGLLPPFLAGILGASTGYLGQSGAWCLIDLRRQPLGSILSTIVSAIIVAAFFFNGICYGLVWAKIKQVSASNAAGDKKKYHSAAKVMMLFVLIYMIQWFFFVIFSLWSFFGAPHLIVFWGAVFFSNIGGLFNFLVYYVIKKKFTSVGSEKKGDKGETTVVTVSSTA